MKAVWISSDNKEDLDSFIQTRKNQIATDTDEKLVFLTETQWSLDREIKENPTINFRYSSEL